MHAAASDDIRSDRDGVANSIKEGNTKRIAKMSLVANIRPTVRPSQEHFLKSIRIYMPQPFEPGLVMGRPMKTYSLVHFCTTSSRVVRQKIREQGLPCRWCRRQVLGMRTWYVPQVTNTER